MNEYKQTAGLSLASLPQCEAVRSAVVAKVGDSVAELILQFVTALSTNVKIAEIIQVPGARQSVLVQQQCLAQAICNVANLDVRQFGVFADAFTQVIVRIDKACEEWEDGFKDGGGQIEDLADPKAVEETLTNFAIRRIKVDDLVSAIKGA